MITDTEIKLKGFDALVKSLGEVTAERFIALIIKDKFDYTKWQRKLFPEIDIETLSQKAMNFRIKNEDILR